MPLQKAMVSSESSEWGTPDDFFVRLDSEFHFTLDPCATKKNAKCKKFFTEKQDGLKQDWSKDVVFMNPPYKGQTAKWVGKAVAESKKGATVVCLLSAATGRKWFHDYVFNHAAQIRWVSGFIKFIGATYGAPFASVVVIFSSKRYHPKHIYEYPARLKEIKK